MLAPLPCRSVFGFNTTGIVHFAVTSVTSPITVMLAVENEAAFINGVDLIGYNTTYSPTPVNPAPSCGPTGARSGTPCSTLGWPYVSPNGTPIERFLASTSSLHAAQTVASSSSSSHPNPSTFCSRFPPHAPWRIQSAAFNCGPSLVQSSTLRAHTQRRIRCHFKGSDAGTQRCAVCPQSHALLSWRSR
jgi:hypothetical protein